MYIHVRTYPDSPKESIEQVSDDHIIIRVREPARQNSANQRILEILQGLYPNTVIRIINGHHSPSKLISIEKKE